MHSEKRRLFNGTSLLVKGALATFIGVLGWISFRRLLQEVRGRSLEPLAFPGIRFEIAQTSVITSPGGLDRLVNQVLMGLYDTGLVAGYYISIGGLAVGMVVLCVGIGLLYFEG